MLMLLIVVGCAQHRVHLAHIRGFATQLESRRQKKGRLLHAFRKHVHRPGEPQLTARAAARCHGQSEFECLRWQSQVMDHWRHDLTSEGSVLKHELDVQRHVHGECRRVINSHSVELLIGGARPVCRERSCPCLHTHACPGTATGGVRTCTRL